MRSTIQARRFRSRVHGNRRLFFDFTSVTVTVFFPTLIERCVKYTAWSTCRHEIYVNLSDTLTVVIGHVNVNAVAVIVDVLRLAFRNAVRHRVDREIVQRVAATRPPGRRHVRHLIHMKNKLTIADRSSSINRICEWSCAFIVYPRLFSMT